MNELIEKRATEIVGDLRRQEISPHDLLDALEQRVELVEGSVNALPTLDFGAARRKTDALLKKPVDARGLLCGLPLPIKDLTHVKGMRTTFGCPIYADNISDYSDVMVDRLEREGGIIYAKSNTPEFGAGGNTFNDVFGATRNPYDLSKSAGGSSGGAAAALASGTAWLAQGSDNAGSLRSPASFCNVVGLRPSLGLIARGPSPSPYQTLSVNGPMARNVEDIALFLDAMAGEDAQDPLSWTSPYTPFLERTRRRTKPIKVAFSPDMGITPVDPEVADLCRHAALKFEEMGVIVEEAAPDLSGVHETYQTLRAFDFATSYGDVLKSHSGSLKPDLVENIEKGINLSIDEVLRATRSRATIRQRVLSFFETYDLLLTPAAIVPPFPVEQLYVKSCNGVTFETYIDWLAIAYAITLVSLPSLSLPCGFTSTGLPVGLQIISGVRNEVGLLENALLLEEALALDLRPILPKERA
ncbi:amidase [Roseovarius aestuarii]|uniref:Acylamidase n=1 Tax=Roseovarius aestuarii TaxID=475083 RepID=A0A1X7BNN0_9RHOB|nr:amidase family protein [Roseovarius aestuarii]SMC11226.1 Acylamidase [Roseovarius aestuarii]